MINISRKSFPPHSVQIVCDGIIQVAREFDQHVLEIEHMDYAALYAEERAGREIVSCWNVQGMGCHVNTVIEDWLAGGMGKYADISSPRRLQEDDLLPEHLPKAAPVLIEPIQQEGPSMTGTQIRLIRASLGVSVRDLGVALGVHFQTINHWQSGAGDVRRATALIADLLEDLRELEENLKQCTKIEVHSKGYRRLKNGRIIPESMFQFVVGNHIITHPEKLVCWFR